MKIRLQITSPISAVYCREHHQPFVRLGRNPGCELAFHDEAAQRVSWIHAQIELTPQGAFLTDLESANGTYVNEERISERTEVHVGDQIRLAKTGPLLEV